MNHDFDVAVAGFGPAGATAACLLGALGLRVLAVDRATEVYNQPRAFALDHEIMRVFQNIGLADAIESFVAPFSASEHYGVDGQLIRRLTMIDPPYPLGWTPSMVFRQPPLEAALRARAVATPGVQVSLGEELTALTQDADGVTLSLTRCAMAPAQTRAGERGETHIGEHSGEHEETRNVTARFVIGCDGASSTVRRLLNIEHEDLDFDEPWLVADVGVNAQGAAKLPKTSAQFCEPARPATYLIGVGEHRRWEIMLLPGETPQQFESDAAVWRLLSRWITPDDGVLWRRAGYRFHALVAREWRKGRVFLAGDAAHQQPPFLGQGMCQGIRDVANLSWKLAAVMQERASDALLDTYGTERSAHVKRLTTTIKHIGRNICERDENKARARDAELIAQTGGVVKSVPRQDLIPPLETGLLSPLAHAANGTLFPQPRVRPLLPSAPLHTQPQSQSQAQPQTQRPITTQVLDDATGTGLRLMLCSGDAMHAAAAHEAAAVCGAQLVRIGTGGFMEQDGIAAAWFARHHAIAALVRPDHYVYGVASDPQQLTSLAAAWAAALRA